MTAQEKLLEYAKEHNKYDMTNQEFIGQMASEGIVIKRSPQTKTVARVKREGKIIMVTETLVTKDVNDKVSETTTEIMRVE